MSIYLKNNPDKFHPGLILRYSTKTDARWKRSSHQEQEQEQDNKG